MSNISSRLLLKIIDQITGKAKAQVNTPAPSEDLYSIVIKEENPDDLIDGVSPAISTDTKVTNGLNLYSQWSSELTWLNKRAVAAGSTDLSALVGARFSRYPRSFDAYIWSPSRNSTHVAAANLFTDDVVEFGTANRGASSTTYTEGESLPSTVAHAWAEVDCTKYGGSTWTLDLGVHYANGSTGTQSIAMSATDTFNVGGYTATANYVATAGSSQMKMSSITGIASGHRMLLIDRTYPSLLTTDYYTGGTEVWIDTKYVGYFDPADAVNFYKGDASEYDTSSSINNVNYEHGKITLNAALSCNFLTDDASFMALNAAEGDGWQEAHYVATAAAGVVTFSGPLYHSFFGRSTNGAEAINLITSVYSVSGSGGTSGDEATIQTVAERTIT